MNNKRSIRYSLLMVPLALSLLIIGCESEMTGEAEDAQPMQSDFAGVQKERNPYLAYEHDVNVKIKEETLRASYQNTLQHCSSDVTNNCTILHASISTGDYASAEIRARVGSEGVGPLIEAGAGGNEITRQSVTAEDLAKPIVDNEKRLEMLRRYQDKLKELENRAAEDIESLIKVTAEISKVQSDIERITGESQHLLQRTQFDVVTIHFNTAGAGSVFAPIGEAICSFGEDLSEGVAVTITAVAFLIPWILILIGLFFLFRWLWPKIRGK